MSSGDELLIVLFERHFKDPASAMLRLEKHLKAYPLSFDLRCQMREMEFPLQPGQTRQALSFIYYYVPDSGWGSILRPADIQPLQDKPSAADEPTIGQNDEDPLSTDFVRRSDGIGLNLGCPVRLLRAFDILLELPPEDREEIRRNLANPTQHLSTVEEILWLSVWKSPRNLRRGGNLPGRKKDVDWAFDSGESPVFLEAKFRPADWPRQTDQGTFIPMTGSFLGKAAPKFPSIPHAPALYVVGISMMVDLSSEVIDQIGAELHENRNIHCVVCRTFRQDTFIVSVDASVTVRVRSLLMIPRTIEFPTNYAVLFHIKDRDRRVDIRKQHRGEALPRPDIFVSHIAPNTRGAHFTEGRYNVNIISRSPDGEPRFVSVPEFKFAPT